MALNGFLQRLGLQKDLEPAQERGGGGGMVADEECVYAWWLRRLMARGMGRMLATFKG